MFFFSIIHRENKSEAIINCEVDIEPRVELSITISKTSEVITSEILPSSSYKCTN